MKAVLSKDLKGLEHSVSVKQAEVMQMDNLEKQRMAIQEETGFGSMTFSQIIQKATHANQSAFQALFQRIEAAVNKIKFCNSRSMDLTRQNMRDIGATLPPQVKNEQSYGYTKKTAEGTTRLQTKG